MNPFLAMIEEGFVDRKMPDGLAVKLRLAWKLPRQLGLSNFLAGVCCLEAGDFSQLISGSDWLRDPYSIRMETSV